MPSLWVFGRRWRVGSDDIVLPATLGTLFNGGWFGTFAYIYWHRRYALSGAHCSGLTQFYVGGLTITALNFAMSMSMIYLSLQGTLINARPRRTLSKVTAAKAVLEAVSFVLTIFATRWAFREDLACDEYVLQTTKNAVKAAWATAIAGLVGFVVIFIPGTGEKKVKSNELGNLESSLSVSAAALQTATARMHTLGRLAGIDNFAALSSIAKLFVDFFSDDLDIVPTDVMASLIVLDKEQNERFEKIRQAMPRELGAGSTSPKPWMTPTLAAHYMKFAAGSYGWPLYIFSSPLASIGLIKVLSKSRFVPRSLPVNIHEDNGLLANTAVIKLTTGLKDEDLVYATYHNKLFEIPFYIALDHEKKSVIVSVRGTLSLEDVFTDLVAKATDGVPVSCIPDASVHSGMLATAQYILRQLLGTTEAEQLLCGGAGTSAKSESDEGGDVKAEPLLGMAFEKLRKQIGNEAAKEYSVVICGHSLGAGVAALLALLLQQHPKYHNLRCFAFSPPGGLMSPSAAKRSEEFICSVVLGDDCVPRLGIVTAFDLKIRVLQIMRDCDTPKHEIMGSWVEHTFRRIVGLKARQKEVDGKSSWDGDYEAQKQVEKFQNEIQKAIERAKAEKASHKRMYPPGLIMYLNVRKEKTRSAKSTMNYDYYWTRGDATVYHELALSGSAIGDHTPWNVLYALNMIAANMI